VGASITIGDEEDGLHTLFVRGVNELHFSIKGATELHFCILRWRERNFVRHSATKRSVEKCEGTRALAPVSTKGPHFHVLAAGKTCSSRWIGRWVQNPHGKTEPTIQTYGDVFFFYETSFSDK
jgi:hypothetical protein